MTLNSYWKTPLQAHKPTTRKTIWDAVGDELDAIGEAVGFKRMRNTQETFVHDNVYQRQIADHIDAQCEGYRRSVGQRTVLDAVEELRAMQRL